MSKHELRKDMTCLNCNHVVEKHYCPNCGQENTNTRKTFHHLFIHFFEDLTHYENAFWKTIVNLLFKPGALTKEYLSGKRRSYLAPVRLYIFISFVTFFLLGVLPHYEPTTATVGQSQEDNNIHLVRPKTNGALPFEELQNSGSEQGLSIGDYRSLRQFDSVQNTLPASARAKGVSKWLQRRLAKVNGENSAQELREKFAEGVVHNIPKALFFYMPIFALFLWLFHSKKRWYYFDHGIFTLHYFSFILSTLCVFLILNSLTSYINPWINQALQLLAIPLLMWWFFYFFRSHSRFYQERKTISRLKSLALFIINVFFLFIFIVGLMVFTAIYIH